MEEEDITYKQFFKRLGLITASIAFITSIFYFTSNKQNENNPQKNLESEVFATSLVSPEVKDMVEYGVSIENYLKNFVNSYSDSTSTGIRFFVRQADSILKRDLIVQESPEYVTPNKAEEYKTRLFLIGEFFSRADETIKSGGNLGSLVKQYISYTENKK